MPFRSPSPAQPPAVISGPTPPTATPSPALDSRRTVKATLRLPKPPPPPKPLYLTVRARQTAERGPVGNAGRSANRQIRTRGELPTWTGTLRDLEGRVAQVRESENEEGGVEPAAGPEEVNESVASISIASPAPAEGVDAPDAPVDAAHSDVATTDEHADEATPRTSGTIRETSFASSSSSQLYYTPVGTLRLEGAGTHTKRSSTIRFRSDNGQLSIFFDPHLHNPFVPTPPSLEIKSQELIATSEGGECAEEDLPEPLVSRPSDSADLPTPTAQELLPLPMQSAPAIALHAFQGISEHGELSFDAGESLHIEVEDVGGGWSLGFTDADGEAGRGLIPRAWYAYVVVQEDAAPQPESSIATLFGRGEQASASHSIKRCVVVSGTEFEPTWLESRRSSSSASAVGETGPPGDTTEEVEVAASATTLVSVAQAAALPALPLLRFLGSAFRASLPLDFAGLVVPGASILAATSAPTFSTDTYERRRRLPRLESETKATNELSKARLLQWIQEGDVLDDEISEATVTFDIETGPLWRCKEDTMSYRAVVSAPKKVNLVGERPHIVYLVATTFAASPIDEVELQEAELEVTRRFSDFAALNHLLRSRFFHPLVLVPTLPPRHDFVLGHHRFDSDFVEERRIGLQAWLDGCVRHPVLGASDELKDFLALPEPRLSRDPGDSADLPLFPARVFHPEFNVDAHDAAVSRNSFSRAIDLANLEQNLSHMRKAIEASFGVRQARHNTITHLSDALISGLGPTRRTSLSSSDRFTSRSTSATLRNASTLLSGLSSTPKETDSTAFNRFERHRKTIHDIAKDAAALLDLHTLFLAEYEVHRQAQSAESEQIAARAETVLNITSAEMSYVEEALNSHTRGFLREWLARLVREQEEDLLDTTAVLALFGPAE